ncbi:MULTISPECIES: heme lyase CcmF/NrfE family subunit [unclassified Psychrobacter]|uniref:heme lyase CcmF/NrfE family subunit n=1 Tax=unclassified Psychrobacter TaxID=196806 RepID=UPI00071E933C|nr:MULTISPECIES: heme lyase CcmF/NrfE family subunit [unclassified Psychrobacter]OLF36431.1 c-type cytochrome biogenesis protein CcmF [Psychrobacter sp. Cmf 22.2]
MLITELGYFALLAAFVLAILQVVLPTIGVMRHQVAWQRLAPSLAWAQFAAMIVSFAALMAGFYYNDFSLVYVAQHSNTLLPWYYKLSATWGGHEGSLLLWMTIMATWCALVSYFSRGLPLSMRARVLVILAAVQMMMLAMLIFTSSPFNRTLPNIPVDGADLNPVLQDFGLIIHPPMLYMGYVGMVVPFAFCMAALWEGRLDAVWTRWSRPWALAAWGFLTIGIALGSWWAYYELGWGGWWFWDPVENASLMPWLAGTALLHSLAVTEKRGVFKAWTIMLAIFAFALSLLGTFLVRSGVITSVHSFAADPTRGLVILAILGIIVGGGLLMFAVRGWRLTVESQYQLISRESFLVINNAIILIATLVVLLGTLYPIIADAFNLGQVSVGPPYFNALFVPLTWLLLLAMGMGSNIRWKKDKRPLLGVGMVIAASSLILAAIIAYFVHPSSMLNIGVTLAVSFWVLLWMIIDFRDKTKNAPSMVNGLRQLRLSYWGQQTAHIGVLIAAIGVAFTSSLSIERDVALGPNDTVHVQGYDFTVKDFREVKGSNFDSIQAQVAVTKDGRDVTVLYPEKRTYIISMMPMTEAAIDASLMRDLYVALGEPIAEGSNQWAVRIYVKPLIRWIWLGSIIMALGALISMLDNRYRIKKVKASHKVADTVNSAAVPATTLGEK